MLAQNSEFQLVTAFTHTHSHNNILICPFAITLYLYIGTYIQRRVYVQHVAHAYYNAIIEFYYLSLAWRNKMPIYIHNMRTQQQQTRRTGHL